MENGIFIDDHEQYYDEYEPGASGLSDRDRDRDRDRDPLSRSNGPGPSSANSSSSVSLGDTHIWREG